MLCLTTRGRLILKLICFKSPVNNQSLSGALFQYNAGAVLWNRVLCVVPLVNQSNEIKWRNLKILENTSQAEIAEHFNTFLSRLWWQSSKMLKCYKNTKALKLSSKTLERYEIMKCQPYLNQEWSTYSCPLRLFPFWAPRRLRVSTRQHLVSCPRTSATIFENIF